MFQGHEVQLARLESTLELPGHWSRSSAGIAYDFANEDLNDFILVGDSWAQNDNGFAADGFNHQLYTPNPYGQGEYSITTTAQLGPGDTAYGYGIFFDAKVQEDGYTESGYIMQFDPGMGDGELIIRE